MLRLQPTTAVDGACADCRRVDWALIQEKDHEAISRIDWSGRARRLLVAGIDLRADRYPGQRRRVVRRGQRRRCADRLGRGARHQLRRRHQPAVPRGETLGDPNAVYSPMVPDNPGPWRRTGDSGPGDGLIGGMPIMPVPAAPDATTTTTTNLASTEGTTTENVPVDAAAPADAAPVASRHGGQPAGSARNTRPGTTLRSPTKTSARRRRTRRWCKRSTPTTTGSPARR